MGPTDDQNPNPVTPQPAADVPAEGGVTPPPAVDVPAEGGVTPPPAGGEETKPEGNDAATGTM